MNCRAVQAKLSAYVDAELSGREMLVVRRHVEYCDRCAGEVDFLRCVKVNVAAIPDVRAPADLEAKLLRAVAGESKARKVRVPRMLSGFAAASVLAVIGFSWVQQTRAENEQARHLRQIEAFELARDQAFVAGGDPLDGDAGVLSVSYGSR